jgi:hypothetical protein
MGDLHSTGSDLQRSRLALLSFQKAKRLLDDATVDRSLNDLGFELEAAGNGLQADVIMRELDPASLRDFLGAQDFLQAVAIADIDTTDQSETDVDDDEEPEPPEITVRNLFKSLNDKMMDLDCLCSILQWADVTELEDRASGFTNHYGEILVKHGHAAQAVMAEIIDELKVDLYARDAEED